MSIEPELLELMTQSIIIENVTKRPGTPTLDLYGAHDTGGQYEYDDPVTIPCRLEYTMKIITDADGRDRMSSGRAYLNGPYMDLTTEAQVTVPDQTQPSLRNPSIMVLETAYDEDGPRNTIVHFE